MSYIEHSLGRNETLLYKARFPWFYRAGAWSLLVLSVVSGFAAYTNGYDWLGAVLAILGVGLFAAIMVPIWTTEIGVTDQRFIYKRGLVWRTTQELQLRAVEEVNLRQGVLGRLFYFGRMDLHGTGVDDIVLPMLADPMGLRKALQNGIAAANIAIAPMRSRAAGRRPHSAA